MGIPAAALILTLLIPAGAVFAQAANPDSQSGSQPPTSPQAAAPAATTAPVAASSLLEPALTLTQNTLAGLKLDKWKKGTVREEAEANVSSLLNDLQTNMPPLLSAADGAPGDLSKTIPVLKHLDAVYDVLLRVEEASRVVAPAEQISALQQALLDVNKARMALDDQMTAQAASQEKQLVDLQASLRTEKETEARELKTASETKATTPCKPEAPAHRKRRTAPAKKTTTQPAAGPPKTQ